MTTELADHTLRANHRTTRLGASLFFFLCIPLSLWDQFYVPRQIFVSQDPVATAKNLLAHEFIFRTSIVSHLTGIFIFVVMVLLFARVFRPVDNLLAWLMVSSVLALIPIIFMLELFNFTALEILKSDTRPTFAIAQQQEAAYFLLRVYRSGVGPGLGKLFFGLSFIPFGLLVLRSGFTPRLIGILLLIGGVGYVADCCLTILLQRTDYLLVRSVLMYTTLAYILALLWFLIKGLGNLGPVIHK